MSNTEYTVAGRAVFLSNAKDKYVPLKNLPVSTYNLSIHPERGFYLETREPFELPKKLYGKTEFRTSKILATFDDRPYTTGVLLHGVKGSGKSMEAKNISVEGLKKGISTIVVPFAAFGPAFNKFLQSIADPVIVLFDEFEKIYKKEDQESLLTLLDGFFNSKKLIVFTANDTNKIDTHMINRPGRIFYNIKYAGLEPEFIEEYCNDALKDTSKTDVVMQVASYIDDFNFDMLQAIIEEHNRYGGKLKELLPLLNIRMDNVAGVTYNVKCFKNGKLVPKVDYVYPTSLRNPLTQDIINMTYEKKYTLKEQAEFEKQGISVDDLEDANYQEFPLKVSDAMVSRGKKFIEFNTEDKEGTKFKFLFEKEEWKPLNILDQINE